LLVETKVATDRGFQVTPKLIPQVTRRAATVFLLMASVALAAQLAPRAIAQSASQDAARPPATPTPVGDGIHSAASRNTGSQAANKTEATGKPGEEGLTVHGYWKIDVHNPDGKLVAHREFENSLANGAASTFLYPLVTGQEAAGDMAILISGPSQPDICHAGTSSDNCYLVISETSGIGGQLCAGGNAVDCTAGLTEAIGSSGAVTLSGNILAAQTTVISTVSTLLLTCSFTTSGFATISPTQCFALNGTTGTPTQPVLTSYGPFTGTTLPTALPVTTGQTVSFQVVITFS
jgi:hypothetical protein